MNVFPSKKKECSASTGSLWKDRAPQDKMSLGEIASLLIEVLKSLGYLLRKEE
jgi:hypothetical protein